MIELSNEMLITKDVYRALVNYGNILVVDLLRQAINLEEKEDEEGEIYYTVREEFERLNFQDGQSQNHYFEELTRLTVSYLDNLSNSDKTALCFRLISDEKYYNQLHELIEELESDTMEQYNRKVGREMARLLYEEDRTELMKWAKEFLLDTVAIFSTEFDFSLIDESTKYSLEHNLEMYKKPAHHGFPI
ncbi:hypothetical protein [Marinifilum fragile]|uniref:hypothetical protein n=1 Tax=Marinifilum fragile TaxID=570161 RepID=UPI002AAB3BAA|nr:hypothetical protein [Marinifilum fragile]